MQKLGRVLLLIPLLLSACGTLPTLSTIYPTATPTAALTPLAPTPQQTFFFSERPPAEELRLTDADQALEFGDYDTALKAYRAASTASSAALRAASLYGQALTYIKQGDLFQAKPLLEELISSYPESLPAQRAHYLKAQIALKKTVLKLPFLLGRHI